MTDSPSDERVHILLVEDNPGDVRLTQEAFAFLDQQVEFHVAKDGAEAVQYLQHHLPEDTVTHPDIILLD